MTDNEGQHLRENVDVRIQTTAEALDHQHAEDRAAERTVLLDSITNHRGEQFRHDGSRVHLRARVNARVTINSVKRAVARQVSRGNRIVRS